MITPFHFACHCEERLRALFSAIDPKLGEFISINRRMGLIEQRAALQFGVTPATGEEFTGQATLSIQTVPQKDSKTALNCVLACPSEKMQRNFRLLLNTLEESESQIVKILEFLQKAFFPLGYTTHIPVPKPQEEPVVAAAAAALAAAEASAKEKKRQVVETSSNEEEVTLPGNHKYILEKNIAPGEPVRMRTADGKYVPDGELPANIRINK